jgi:hypothetical protein
MPGVLKNCWHVQYYEKLQRNAIGQHHTSATQSTTRGGAVNTVLLSAF